jgi:hypothetical protein
MCVAIKWYKNDNYNNDNNGHDILSLKRIFQNEALSTKLASKLKNFVKNRSYSSLVFNTFSAQINKRFLCTRINDI